MKRAQANLVLEEETLKNPERIDSIARNELGMTTLRPNQLIATQFQVIESKGTEDLAMADVPIQSAGPRKLSDTN